MVSYTKDDLNLSQRFILLPDLEILICPIRTEEEEVVLKWLRRSHEALGRASDYLYTFALLYVGMNLHFPAFCFIADVVDGTFLSSVIVCCITNFPMWYNQDNQRESTKAMRCNWEVWKFKNLFNRKQKAIFLQKKMALIMRLLILEHFDK